MSTQTMPPRPAGPPQQRPKLPPGLKWSNVWKVGGSFVESPDPAVELPVNQAWEISGRLWVCPTEGCGHDAWTFDGAAEEKVPCCPRHPARLIAAPLNGADTDPASAARTRVKAWASGVYERRKRQATQAVQARIDAAHKAAADAARRTAADMQGHVPSIAASVSVLGAGMWLEFAAAPLAALVGAGMCVFGALIGYVVAWWWQRMQVKDRADAKRAARDRRTARHVASGVLASGVWLASSAGAGYVLPLTLHVLFTTLFGLLLMFAVNNAHWQELWDARHRIKEMNRLKAEAEAARAAAEKKRIENLPDVPGPVPEDESDPAVVGARMAEEWARIAATQGAASQFSQMPRTWINPAETREITVPDEDGTMVRIGWEYEGHSQPGALVARQGMPSPVVSARDWLAAVLFNGRWDAPKISIVDRPGGQANRFVLTVAERFPLGDAVAYKGAAGIRRGADGSLFGHIGKTLLGDDAERILWIPGQAGGGGRYGVTGSGKTVVTQTSLLNDLYAGIFSVLWDGKNLMDFAEFIGVIPVGCTVEHRDVMRRSLHAEMERRQQMLMAMEGVDRHGRPAPVEALWVPDRDGPPLRWTIEEFHLNARNDEFIADLTALVRLQRSAAGMVEISTQGGGLADAGDSVLRDNLNQIAMQIMRMGDSQAQLTGYRGDYMPSQLPRLPGMMLMVEADAPAVPVRAAYVHRRDEDGNIYDHLYDRDNQPILTAPVLPAETLEVFEREGLMDLWRMGQGPGGKQRLLNSGPVSPSSVSPQAAGIDKKADEIRAKKVLLAIVVLNPGIKRARIDAHSVWPKPEAFGKAPAPSTISRAAQVLDAAGLIRRDNGCYWVTESGRDEAKLAAVEVGLADDESEETGDE